MAALLQGAATNKNKTALYLGEARRMGIQVLSPDVNESVYEYSAVGDVVRFGLGAIRNVGENAVKDIIAERETGRGKYVNFMDFIRRVPLTALNRRLVESLIKAGAFDSIDPNRRALFTVHESAIDSVVGLKRKQAEGQFDLFSDTEDSGATRWGMRRSRAGHRGMGQEGQAQVRARYAWPLRVGPSAERHASSARRDAGDVHRPSD